jgi:ribonuclease P protein component
MATLNPLEKTLKARTAGPLVVQTLRQRRDFLTLKAQGGRVHAAAFVLQWLARPGEATLGVGFTCSGALGNAVRRNRARRRLKAAFDATVRLNPAAKLAGEGRWLVLVGKHAVFDVDFQQLCAELRTALAQAGVLA